MARTGKYVCKAVSEWNIWEEGKIGFKFKEKRFEKSRLIYFNEVLSKRRERRYLSDVGYPVNPWKKESSLRLFVIHDFIMVYTNNEYRRNSLPILMAMSHFKYEGLRKDMAFSNFSQSFIFFEKTRVKKCIKNVNNAVYMWRQSIINIYIKSHVIV